MGNSSSMGNTQAASKEAATSTDQLGPLRSIKSCGDNATATNKERTASIDEPASVQSNKSRSRMNSSHDLGAFISRKSRSNSVRSTKSHSGEHKAPRASSSPRQTAAEKPNSPRPVYKPSSDPMSRFDVLEYLGEGKQGRVDKVQHRKSGYVFAMKTLEGASPSMRRTYGRSPGGGAHSEVTILRRLRHRNVVQLVDVIDSPKDNTLRLILEYVPGGCIKQLSDQQLLQGVGIPLDEEVARTYFRQLLSALDYLFCHGVLHRDVKPSNLLVNPGTNELKLGDFGIAMPTKASKAARVLGSDDDIFAGNMVGTPAFLPPEFYRIMYGLPPAGEEEEITDTEEEEDEDEEEQAYEEEEEQQEEELVEVEVKIGRVIGEEEEKQQQQQAEEEEIELEVRTEEEEKEQQQVDKEEDEEQQQKEVEVTAVVEVRDLAVELEMMDAEDEITVLLDNVKVESSLLSNDNVTLGSDNDKVETASLSNDLVMSSSDNVKVESPLLSSGTKTDRQIPPPIVITSGSISRIDTTTGLDSNESSPEAKSSVSTFTSESRTTSASTTETSISTSPSTSPSAVISPLPVSPVAANNNIKPRRSSSPPTSANAGPPTYHGRDADLWAAGMTLYAFMYGGLPFISSGVGSNATMTNGAEITGCGDGSGGPSDIDWIAERMIYAPLRFPGTGLGTSLKLRQLLSRMLEKNPEKRARLPELMKDPWVCKHKPMPRLTNGEMQPLFGERPNRIGGSGKWDEEPVLVRSIKRVGRRLRSHAHILHHRARASLHSHRSSGAASNSSGGHEEFSGASEESAYASVVA